MTQYNLSDFDYDLPADLIAQNPVEPRDHCKLMVLNREKQIVLHKLFYEIDQFLEPGDLLILNDTKVFPARLLGSKADTAGKAEILLHRELQPGLWEVIGRNLKVGGKIIFANSPLEAIIKSHYNETYQAVFNLSGPQFFEEIKKIGLVPLPPYIPRPEKNEADESNYQTIYARAVGSVAAPTAGLHFTDEVFKKLKAKGIQIGFVTLHVGMGTFSPVKTEKIEEHKMHSEYFMLKKDVLQKILETKKRGNKVIAVGTTTTRVLESVFAQEIEDKDYAGETNIFIYPGYKFHCIDGLITNFHTPKSSLLMLVSALAGKDFVDQAYKEAVEKKYRFYSYGDAMLII